MLQYRDFVTYMEQVVDVYKEPDNKAGPVVGMDESSKQLIKETRIPIKMRRGCPKNEDLNMKGVESPMCLWQMSY